jgi:DNA-binding transcriptional LysR family regulator
MKPGRSPTAPPRTPPPQPRPPEAATSASSFLGRRYPHLSGVDSVIIGHFLPNRNMDNRFFKRYDQYRMDTRSLESFVSVIDNGSIAEAARRLNLTPAGVAKRIRALETEIGDRLISRSGRTVRPTRAAMAILDRARLFLREARDLKSLAAIDRPVGELRLGAVQTTLTGMLPDILALTTQTYPQIEIHIIRDSSTELYRKVLGGDVDAAILSRPPFAIPKTCEWRDLREEPFVVLTPAPAPDRHPHDILAEEPFIRLDRSLHAGRLIDAYLRRAGIRPRERFELDGIEAIAVMVDRGLGVAILPDWAPPWPEGLSLAKLPLPDRSFTRRTGLLWTRASLRVGLIHAFLEQAERALAPGRATTRHPKGRRPAPRR